MASTESQSASAQGVSQKFLGGATDFRSDTITVFTTPTVILKYNPRRVFALLVNRGSTDIDLDTTENVQLGNGGILAANGGTMILIAFIHGALTGSVISGITSLDNTNLYVQEVYGI